MDVEAGNSAGDRVEHAPRGDRSYELGDYVGQQFRGREAFAHHQPQADRGIQMAAGDVANGEGHGQNGEPEGESDAGVADADVGDAGGQNGGAASAETPARKFRKIPLLRVYRWAWGVSLSLTTVR